MEEVRPYQNTIIRNMHGGQMLCRKLAVKFMLKIHTMQYR